MYALGYRFYAKFIAAKVMALDDRRATPAERLREQPRFRADQQVDRLRPSLRGHRRSRAARRADAGGAIWLSAGDAVDHLRRGARRLRPGLHHPLRVHPPGRQIARPDGDGRRSGQLAASPRSDHRAPHHDHPARRHRAGRGQRPPWQPLGGVHDPGDDADRDLHGRVSSLLAARPGPRSVRHRLRARAPEHLRRPGGPRARRSRHGSTTAR